MKESERHEEVHFCRFMIFSSLRLRFFSPLLCVFPSREIPPAGGTQTDKNEITLPVMRPDDEPIDSTWIPLHSLRVNRFLV